MADVSRYTAGIPPLHTVGDANVRRVLEALVNGWRIRNGDTKPSSDERFVTLGEIQRLVESANSGYFAPGGAGYNLLQTATESQSPNIQEILDDVFRSPLFLELGERIRRVNTDVVREQNARIAAVQQVADDLAAEAATRLGFDEVHGSAIDSLETVTTEQATQISGLTTRIGNAESTIIELDQTTATQAVSLEQLSTRVGASESVITELEITTADQATSLDSLSTRVGSAESSISTLNTTTANQAASLTSLTTRVESNTAAITNEATVRANADNALSTTFTTQLAQTNTSLAAVQTQTNTLTNSIASVSQSVTTLQATVGENTAAIEQETSARVAADGTINSRYTIKIDNNGYVSGIGLMSSANNSTPFSEFIVRADRFVVANPAGATTQIPLVAPFSVVTTPQTINGKTVPPGVYMDAAYIKNGSIDSARIGNAAVDTLTIAGNAVTQPVTFEYPYERYYGAYDEWQWVGQVYVDLGTPPAGGTVGALVMFTYEHQSISGGTHPIYYQMLRNQIPFFTGSSVAVNNSPTTTVTSFVFDVSSGGPSYYALLVKENGDVRTPSIIKNIRLFVLGTKR